VEKAYRSRSIPLFGRTHFLPSVTVSFQRANLRHALEDRIILKLIAVEIKGYDRDD